MTNPIKRYAHWLHLQWPSGEVEKLPRVDDHFRTNVPGVYVVGDLAGVPLLKFSLDGGTKAVRDIVNDKDFEPSGASGTRTNGPRTNGAEEDGTVQDLIVLGAGASGMAAAREAEKQGLSYTVLEAQRRFATIKDFQKGKPIYTYPNEMVPAGDLMVSAEVKEALVEELEAQTDDIPVSFEEAERIERVNGHLEVVTEAGGRRKAQRVIVAIGRSGNYRALGVPGEDRDIVHHRLLDPSHCRGHNVIVIGGGDSALEAAIALVDAGAHVTLSYRREQFTRPKPENIDQVYERASYHDGEGGLRLLLGSDVEEVSDGSIRLTTKDGEETTLDVDMVFAMIGREAPLDFFRRSGIELRNDWGDTPDSPQEAVTSVSWLAGLNWSRVLPMIGFVLFMAGVYSLTKGGWVADIWRNFNLFPLTLNDDAAAAPDTSIWKVLLVSASSPSFYYTLAYSAIVVTFGFRRIQRRKTPYVRVQTLTLMAIQVVPLFILPEILLPYLGANGLLPEGFLDALFPAVDYGHGREYWRAYGLILAWPLNVYNVFTTNPLWWWLAICFVQTFVLIPAMIYYWGKGAYCGWICSCGALAETLGDTHRDKMPHGENWNKFNMAGQAILALVTVILILRIVGWVAPGGWAEAAYNQAMNGTIAGLQINYFWVVDVVLAGMIGYGVYFWLSGRFWCRFLCPLAALMHVYTRFSRFRILADKKKCISCNVCTSVCHQGIDVMSFAQQGLPMDDPECVRCSACVQSCPTGVLSFGQIEPGTGQIITVDELEASLTRITEEQSNGAAQRKAKQGVQA